MSTSSKPRPRPTTTTTSSSSSPRKPPSARAIKKTTSSTGTTRSGNTNNTNALTGKNTSIQLGDMREDGSSIADAGDDGGLIKPNEIVNAEQPKPNPPTATATSHLHSQITHLSHDLDRTERLIAERDVALDRAEQEIKGLQKKEGEMRRRLGEQEKNFEQERTHYTLLTTHQTSQIKQLQIDLNLLSVELDRSKVGRVQGVSEEEKVGVVELEGTDDGIRQAQPVCERENQRLLVETQTLSGLLETTRLELSTTRESVRHVEVQLAHARSELEEQKSINERLREENEVWEGLVGTRTLEGTIGLGIGIGTGVSSHSNGGGKAMTEDGQTMGSVRGSSTWKHSRRVKGKSLADELEGFDLVAFGKGLEDGTINDDKVDQGETDRLREENEDLRLEVKQLNEANRGLRLYCSKILDRILSHSDSEQFLAGVSSDPTTSRKIPVRPARSRTSSIKPSRPRSAVLDRAVSEEYVTPVQADPKTGLRPLSMLGGNLSRDRASPSPEPPKVVEQAETSTEKRARRGLSLNWGPFTTFGGAATVPSPRTENAPVSVASPESRPMNVSPAPSFNGRKLQTHEEDDEDRVERERMAATMKLMGLDTTSPQSTLALPEAPAVDMQRSNSAQSQVSVSPSEPSPALNQPARPVSRWSSFFTRSTPAEPATSPNPTETTPTTTNDSPVLGDLAETVKQAHEQRKREERETLRNNKREPPRSVMDIMTARSHGETPKTHVTRPSVDSMGSLEEMRHPIAAGFDEQERQVDRKPRGSVSTLFDASVHDH